MRSVLTNEATSGLAEAVQMMLRCDPGEQVELGENDYEGNMMTRSDVRLMARLFLPVVVLIFSVLTWCDPACAAPPAKPAKAHKTETAKKVKPLDAEKLRRTFRQKREDARRASLNEIERFHLADPALPEALWQAIEPAIRSPQIQDSLLHALRIYGLVNDPKGGERLISLLSAADLRVELIAIDLLGERRAAESLKSLAALQEHDAYDQNYALRHAVVSAVARFNEPSCIDFLVSTLGSSEGQLKYVAAVELSRLTGENFGGKADDWRKWWQMRRDGFHVITDANAKPPVAPMAWDQAVPQFFGAQVFAKRVVFVIDRSSSMASSVDGVTRLDMALKELEATVAGLPDDAWFEIIAFSDKEFRFAGKLVQATQTAKANAAAFMSSLTAFGNTDSYDALVDALGADQNIEAILFLTDGDPDVGTIVDRPTIVKAITLQNRLVRASIHTIGIDARGISKVFLQDLARSNFGTFRSIR
jgi:hypothetical protein